MIAVRVIGADETALFFRSLGGTAQARMDAVTSHYAEILKLAVQAAASGRPGPNVITGEYRSSWSVSFESAPGGGLAAVVGTSEPYGRRLEFGFNGVDSLGRFFNQPPYPHVNPSADAVEPAYVAALAKGIVP